MKRGKREEREKRKRKIYRPFQFLEKTLLKAIAAFLSTLLRFATTISPILLVDILS